MFKGFSAELIAVQGADILVRRAGSGKWATQVEGSAMDAGHFFAEELPAETASALQRFFG